MGEAINILVSDLPPTAQEDVREWLGFDPWEDGECPRCNGTISADPEWWPDMLPLHLPAGMAFGWYLLRKRNPRWAGLLESWLNPFTEAGDHRPANRNDWVAVCEACAGVDDRDPQVAALAMRACLLAAAEEARPDEVVDE